MWKRTSFLTGQFGDLIDTAWTSTQRHPRIAAGWIFTAPQDKWPGDTEILCVPFVQGDDGALQPMFELLADQRQELKELASSGKLDGLSVVKLPQREYRPGPGQAGGGRDS